MLVVEIGLLTCALGLGWLGFFDRRQSWEVWQSQLQRAPLSGLGCAGVALAVLLALAATIELVPLPGIRRLRGQLLEVVAPLFAGLPGWKIVVIATAAGLGEEFFFRWSLQGGLVTVGFPVFWAVLVAALVFGLCHYLSVWYAVYAGLAGVVLGLAMEWSQSVWPAVLAHAAYDAGAILYLARQTAPRSLLD